ncbi:MAG: V-type ATP synthase subunit D [Candidatus Saganbacteria bacterium]|nr:V-type ATP synthase subunit D [Candidatus Saganbacteria bacterium]
MRKNPNPTRMELLRLSRRRVMAERGHKLLKDKLDGLTHRFMDILKVYRKSSANTYQQLSKIFTKMILASAQVDETTLDMLTFSPKRESTLDVTIKNIMGVKIHSYNLKTEGELRNYGYLHVPAEVDESSKEFADLFPTLIKLAESKKAIELIAKEIYDIKRRVNALEFILIPELSSMITYIKMKLAEMERANRVALIKIKGAVK